MTRPTTTIDEITEQIRAAIEKSAGDVRSAELTFIIGDEGYIDIETFDGEQFAVTVQYRRGA